MPPSSRWSLGHIYTPHRPPLHPPLPPSRLFHLPHKAQSQVLHAFPSLILCFHIIFHLFKEKAPSVSASILILLLLFNWLCILVCLLCVCVCVSSFTTPWLHITFSSAGIKKTANLAEPIHFISASVFTCPSVPIQPLDGDAPPLSFWYIWVGKLI